MPFDPAEWSVTGRRVAQLRRLPITGKNISLLILREYAITVGVIDNAAPLFPARTIITNLIASGDLSPRAIPVRRRGGRLSDQFIPKMVQGLRVRFERNEQERRELEEARRAVEVEEGAIDDLEAALEEVAAEVERLREEIELEELEEEIFDGWVIQQKRYGEAGLRLRNQCNPTATGYYRADVWDRADVEPHFQAFAWSFAHDEEEKKIGPLPIQIMEDLPPEGIEFPSEDKQHLTWDFQIVILTKRCQVFRYWGRRHAEALYHRRRVGRL